MEYTTLPVTRIALAVAVILAVLFVPQWLRSRGRGRDQAAHASAVLRENILKPGEFMTHITIPNPPGGVKFGWSKLKDRQVYDFALTSVAVAFTMDGNNWKDGRITLGGVSPVPYRAKVVEDALKGKNIKDTAKAAAAQIRTVARPMSLNSYKVDVAAGLIERTILEALDAKTN